MNRRSIELRYRLLPTPVTPWEARGALPALRPLFRSFPTTRAAPAEDEMLLGADLLLAPVLTEGATQREVYLPPGRGSISGPAAAGRRPHAISLAVTPESMPLFSAWRRLRLPAAGGAAHRRHGWPAADGEVYPPPIPAARCTRTTAPASPTRGGFARRAFEQQRDGRGVALRRRPSTDATVVLRARCASSSSASAQARCVRSDGRVPPRRDGDDFERASAAWTERDGAVW